MSCPLIKEHFPPFSHQATQKSITCNNQQRRGTLARQSTGLNALAYADGDATAQDASSRPRGPRDWHVWSSGIVSFGNADPTLQRSRLDFTTAGVSAGFDYRFAPSFTAGLAAGYSKARKGGRVAVHLCRCEDVSKPRGFPPGKVLLDRYRSVQASPWRPDLDSAG